MHYDLHSHTIWRVVLSADLPANLSWHQLKVFTHKLWWVKIIENIALKMMDFKLLAKYYFVAEIALTSLHSVREKKVFTQRKIQSWRPIICKKFVRTKTIYLNSKRSKQFLKQNIFKTCCWRFLQIKRIKTIKSVNGIIYLWCRTFRSKLHKLNKSLTQITFILNLIFRSS